jgi:hypothetical protein
MATRLADGPGPASPLRPLPRDAELGPQDHSRRLPSAEETKIGEIFERYGRADVSPASAHAFAEHNPRLADELGITAGELAMRNMKSITLEEAVQHGLFEPIDDDPLAPFRKR